MRRQAPENDVKKITVAEWKRGEEISQQFDK
jgi:hypothetical protein